MEQFCNAKTASQGGPHVCCAIQELRNTISPVEGEKGGESRAAEGEEPEGERETEGGGVGVGVGERGT